MLPPNEVGQRFAAQLATVQVPAERERHRIVGGNDLLARGLAAKLGIVCGCPRQCGRSTKTVRSSWTGGICSRQMRWWPRRRCRCSVACGGRCPANSARCPTASAARSASNSVAESSWRDYGRNGTVLSDRQWGHLWETTDDQSGDAGILTNLAASHARCRVVALPESVDRVLAEIERLFPGAKGHAGQRVRTDWTDDPWTLGCYACFGPGQWAAAQPRCTPPTARCGWQASTPTDTPASWRVHCAVAHAALLASAPADQASADQESAGTTVMTNLPSGLISQTPSMVPG